MTDSNPTMLARREVIKKAMVAVGATSLIGGQALLNSACAQNEPRNELALRTGTFTAEQIRWLDEIAETILPATDTPGAKAAQVGAFIAIMVNDTYSPTRQAQFAKDMEALEEACIEANGAGFLQIDPHQRLAFLSEIEAARHAAQNKAQESHHYFQAFKELTVLGYFTSEIGYTQAMRYIETPGRYDPCVEYVTGQPAWARHA